MAEEKKPSRKLDLVGMKFNRLTVLERTDKRSYRSVLWKCVCDCGTICFYITNDIISGRRQSCGCALTDFNHTKLLPPGGYGFNQLFRKYKDAAKRRGLLFDIPKEDFRTLTLQNCYYCGSPPSGISQPNTAGKVSKEAFENGIYVYSGLDRVDNEVGYTLSNVVPCCAHCNKAKLDMTKEEFITLVHRIAMRHPLPVETNKQSENNEPQNNNN